MSVLDERLDGRVAAQQIQGERPYQEDDYGLIEPRDEDRSEVLLLADGMGGHVSGDTASSTIVRTFAETYPDTEGPIPDRLRTCLNAANDALAAAIAENLALKGMGSTVVAVVMEENASTDADSPNSSTPLHVAALNNNYRAVELLLRQGADVNAKDNYGWTPLHVATLNDAAETAEVLRQYGGQE